MNQKKESGPTQTKAPLHGALGFRATALAVFRKEIVDALRDRRTLMTVLLSSVLMGPLVLVALSNLIASLETRADKREVVVAGIERAPTLRNYIERQTYTLQPAPADYEAKLRASKLGDPVVVIPVDFEAKLAHGESPTVEIVVDSANRNAEAGAGRVERLLQGFSQERAMLSLALRGVSNELLSPIRIDERDLASTQTRAAQFTAMLPFFVIMAVLYGALNAALDTTAGERERGSLEPLLMTPAERGALVLGKWGAVASLSMLIALLSSLSFIPSQWLLRSDSLQAMFQYGGREVAAFLIVLVPLAAAVSALLMAVAIRCRSFKEAQAGTTVVILAFSLLPMVTLFNTDGEAPWHLWVPGLAQNTLMTRALKGESLSFEQALIPFGVCVAITALCVVFIARGLRVAASRP